MLSEDEKEAIKKVEEIKNMKFIITSSFYSRGAISLSIVEKEAIDIVLNLITKLQKENEEKDNQIDLMIEEYEYNARINFKNFCEDELRKDNCIQDCKSCAKQYFEKLVKEKG